MARIKQAVWDAFNGTAQPIFAEPGAPLRTMKVRLNEVGWQVAIPPGSQAAYYGNENVPLTDDGNQAAIYGNLIPYLACDASVRSLLFFNMVDAPNLDGWQSGLLRADWTRRPSYNIVKSAIDSRSTRCNRRPVVWRHARTVVGVKVKFPDLKRPRRERETAWTFNAAAEESATFTAALFPATKQGVLPAAKRAKITRALRGGAGSRSRPEVARKGRRRLGASRALPEAAAEARLLRVRGPARSRDESRAHDDPGRWRLQGRRAPGEAGSEEEDHAGRLTLVAVISDTHLPRGARRIPAECLAQSRAGGVDPPRGRLRGGGDPRRAARARAGRSRPREHGRRRAAAAPYRAAASSRWGRRASG